MPSPGIYRHFYLCARPGPSLILLSTALAAGVAFASCGLHLPAAAFMDIWKRVVVDARPARVVSCRARARMAFPFGLEISPSVSRAHGARHRSLRARAGRWWWRPMGVRGTGEETGTGQKSGRCRIIACRATVFYNHCLCRKNRPIRASPRSTVRYCPSSKHRAFRSPASVSPQGVRETSRGVDGFI